MEEFDDRWELTPEEYDNLRDMILETKGDQWLFEQNAAGTGHIPYYRGKKMVIRKLYDLGLMHYNRLEDID
jgi:hypothetical protein